MAPPGLLYVTMQPKEGLPPSQFHEWYNNEHGPTRLRLPQIFTNGLRYVANDGAQPQFLAMYDVTDMSHLLSITYTSLREQRSPREAETIAQVAVDRQFWDLVSEKSVDGFVPLEKQDFEQADKEGFHLVAVGLTFDGPEGAEEFEKWFEEEHVDMLSKVPGWLRSRRYKFSSIEGSGKPYTFLSLHEYKKENGLGGPEHRASMDTPWRTKVVEKVTDKFRRTYNSFYIFGPAPRDLTSLSSFGKQLTSTSQMDSSPYSTYTSPDTLTRTYPHDTHPAIESYITTPDGHTLSYRLEGNPSPTAPLILFSNSLLTSWAMWNRFLVLLHILPRSGLTPIPFRILRYNTRGRSSPGPSSITLETVSSDIHALLTALRIPKVDILIGVSLGGATTLSFTLQHPHMVKKLIACDFNAASSPANEAAWDSRIELATSSPSGIKELASQTVARWFSPSADKENKTYQEIVEMVASNDVPGFAASAKALYNYDLIPKMKECPVEALFVVGEEDGKLPQAIQGFAGKMGEKGAAFKVVKGAGHLPMVEKPEEFLEAVKGFMGI